MFIPLNVSTFLLLFTRPRTVLSLFLRSFNYLITYPQGNRFHLHDTTLQLFQFFGTKIIFFSTLMAVFFKKNVFHFPLRTLLEPILSTMFCFLWSVPRFFPVSFPSLFRRTRHGGVGQRSGTGLETLLLGWALPLKILNHMSLGVHVPVFFHPGDVASFPFFFSLFRYPLSGYLVHNSITNLLVIKALLLDLGSAQSQIPNCAGFCPPLPFSQDRVAVGPTT